MNKIDGYLESTLFFRISARNGVEDFRGRKVFVMAIMGMIIGALFGKMILGLIIGSFLGAAMEL